MKRDYIDCKILNYVEEHGAAENLKKVAKAINVPVPTVHKRIKNLKEKGIIRKTQYDLDHEKLNLPILALIAFKVEDENVVDGLDRKFGKSANVVISFETYGAFDYLLGIYVESAKQLYSIKEELKKFPGVKMIYSTYVGLKYRFSTVPFPLKEG